MKKHWLGWIVLSLLILLLPAVVLAEGGTCGENLTWNLKNGVLTISGTGKMDDYDGRNSLPPWYGNKKAVTSAVLEEGITDIGDWAFCYCNSLTSIILPEGVTSIGDDAFYDCTSLTSITLPDSLTSIGNYAFNNCSNLILTVSPDSYAEQYAKEKNLSYFCSEGDTSRLFD